MPLTIKGRDIFGKRGKRIKLRCVNWEGLHLKQAFPGGANKQSIDLIVDLMFSLGINCVRLVYSLDIIYNNITTAEWHREEILKANPQFADPRN